MKYNLIQKKKISLGGFTLAEVTLALGVMAVGILGVVGMLATGARSANEANERTLANQIARDIMEDLAEGENMGSSTGTYAYRYLSAAYPLAISAAHEIMAAAGASITADTSTGFAFLIGADGKPYGTAANLTGTTLLTQGQYDGNASAAAAAGDKSRIKAVVFIGGSDAGLAATDLSTTITTSGRSLNTNLALVTISVEFPANSKKELRRKYTYYTYLASK